MLIAVFNNDTDADAGLHALRRLHDEGDISLYATGVIAQDALGKISVKQAMDQGATGTGVGLAVGGLIGLLGGPVGLVVGAATGALAGAMSDLWTAGVGFDFLDEAEKQLQAGKVAVVAEIEEEWVTPVDSALEALGGVVFRRARSTIVEAQVDHDIATLQAEMAQLEAEAAQATGTVKAKLQHKVAATQARLDAAIERAKQRVDALKRDAATKTASRTLQIGTAKEDAKAKVEDRLKQMKSAYHVRGAKLSRAWDLTKEALVG